jgi:hypothetical protein
VIHCRDAEERLATIVREAGMPPRGGVIHCFTGNASSARAFLALGFYISFSGILTFRNAAQVREDALIVPPERLMIETDAPYLAPEPHRGQRNEPAYVLRTLEVLARLRGVHTDVLAQATAENARRLFGLSALTAGPPQTKVHFPASWYCLSSYLRMKDWGWPVGICSCRKSTRSSSSKQRRPSTKPSVCALRLSFN